MYYTSQISSYVKYIIKVSKKVKLVSYRWKFGISLIFNVLFAEDAFILLKTQ